MGGCVVNLESCFIPLFILCRVVGLDFRFEFVSVNKRLAFVLLGLLWITATSTGCFYWSFSKYHSVSQSSRPDKSSRERVKSWYSFVTVASYCICNVFLQLLLYVNSFSKIPALLRSLLELNKKILLQKTYLRLLFVKAWTGVVASVIWTVTRGVLLNVLVRISTPQPQRDQYTVAALVFYYHSYIYQLITNCLQLICCSAISEYFKQISEEAASAIHNRGDIRKYLLLHSEICEVTKLFHQCFNTSSLLYVVSSGIALVNMSLFSFESWIKSSATSSNRDIVETVWYMVRSGEIVARFWYICYTTDKLHNQAEKIVEFLRSAKLIREGQCPNWTEQIKNETRELILMHTLPKFDVFGLFRLGLQLFPALISTALTYTIVICQNTS